MPRITALLATLTLTGALAEPAAAQRQGPRLRIGVMDLSGSALMVQNAATPTGTNTSVQIPPPSDFARGLTQMLTTALKDYPEFVVLERAQLAQVMAEQDLGSSGRVNPQTAASMGQVLGAQALITGDITEFSYSQSSMGSKMSIVKSLSQQVGAKLDRVTARVAIDLRLIDAATGEVIGSVRGEGSASANGVGAELTAGDKQFALGGEAQTPLGKASREAMEESVNGLAKALRRVPWTGRVAQIRGADIYINAGAALGIQPGMAFDVFSQTEAIVDPETGASLGAPDTRTARLVIRSVAEKYAVGRTAGPKATVRKNDLVRFAGQGPMP